MTVTNQNAATSAAAALPIGTPRHHIIIFASLLVLLLIAPFVLYPVFIMKILCFALFASALNLLLGFGGLLSFGHAAFFGSASYITAHAAKVWGLSPELAILLGTLSAAFLGLVIGALAIRRQGIYFAMVTLVLTEVARLLAMALPITNGAKGMVSIPMPGGISLFGLTILPDFATLQNPRAAFYFVSIVLMVLCFAGLYRLINSRIGGLCQSLQQNEELASSIGVNITNLRVLAYAISSFLGGLGGAMFVAISQSIYPSSFTVTDSVNFMLNCFLGGLGYVFGPIIGTFVLYFGWDFLFQTGKFQLLIFSSVLIILMLFLPNGLLSLRLTGKKGAGS